MYKDGKLLTAGEEIKPHSGLFGVRKYIPEKCETGYTLFSADWGYTEYLMDMRGLVVHTWPVTHSQLAELLPNGNLLVDNDGRWLEELSPDGSMLWRWEGKERLELPNHHDFYRVDEDEIVLIARKKEPVIEGVYRRGLEPECMKTDLVLRINHRRDILWEFSFSDHLDELCELSGLPLPIPYVYWKGGDQYQVHGPADWAHTNTVEILPPTSSGEKDTRFKAGNILVSFRALDIIAIIDPDKDAFVWCYGLGILDGQHQPTMLDNGNILVFDNGTYRGYSIVREINPLTGETVWEYVDKENFFSPYRSGAQRLSNGNTLICESVTGRIFEVTPDKEIVWDFYSPFVGQGPSHFGRRIYRPIRYPPSYVEPLLKSREDKIFAGLFHAAIGGQPIEVKTYWELIQNL